MNNHYKGSWELYKSQTQDFTDDFAYYFNFCKNSKVLDIFAGFGRLTNYLFKNGVDIEAVELEPNFAQFIKIPSSKIHVCNVLNFFSSHPFERIIAGFNSFCLFTEDEDIKKFFCKISELLSKNGMASLSYYHHDFWKNSISYTFDYRGKKVYYEPDYDLSKIDSDGIGVWIDRYKGEKINLEFKYLTKIYKSAEQIEYYLKDCGLFLKDVIKDYRSSEPNGFVEFIIAKQ